METDQGFDLHNALEALATVDTAQAGGSAAAFVGAIAAAVTVKVARLSGQEGVSAQALSLRARLAGLAPTDAEAFAEARKALAVGEGGGDVRRDFQLGLVLNRASAVPLEIAEACADVSALAAELARTGEADAQPDAAVAAVLAAAAAHAAVRLVEVNLALGTDDPRIARARAVARSASAAAEFVPGGAGT